MNSMLWDRCLVMALSLSKAQLAGQLLSPSLSAPGGPLHDKLLNRLGALDAATIDKPKEMHRKTFDAVLAAIERCNMGSLAIVAEKWRLE